MAGKTVIAGCELGGGPAGGKAKAKPQRMKVATSMKSKGDTTIKVGGKKISSGGSKKAI